MDLQPRPGLGGPAVKTRHRSAPAARRLATLAVGTLLLVVSALFVVGGEGLLLGSEDSDMVRPGGYNWAAPQVHRPDPGTLAVGVTHTEHSIDHWNDNATNASAKAVLTATASYQNQHIFGWGALNPEPSPGVYDWSSLDRRMELIRSTGGTPVITLCCAPDWMKGGEPGETDWDRLEVAPSPTHYGDFAALAAAVARRYPDVGHFQVWNELKGFWDEARERWDYEAYTDFYNVVYDALKAVNPRIAVGGPYVVVDVWANPAAGGHPSALSGVCGTVDQRGLDVLEYWLRHKHGADFVALDASSGTRDQGMITLTSVSGKFFDAITRWLRERTSLPVWWSEFHVGRARPYARPQLVARAVSALLHMADAGASAALVWQPQEDSSGAKARPPALWTSTENRAGGRPLAYAEALARLQQILADRVAADPVSWPLPQVGVLRGQHALLIVHTEAGPAEVTVEGRRVPLGPYEVRYLALAPGHAMVRVSADPAPLMPVTGDCLA